MIKKTNNRIIKSRGGKIFKFIDKNNNFYKNFGEIYLNHIKKNKKKIDWIYHKKCQCLITVIVGKVDFILVDIEKKVISRDKNEYINIERSVKDEIKKSKIFTYKGNDLTVQACETLINYICITNAQVSYNINL